MDYFILTILFCNLLLIAFIIFLILANKSGGTSVKRVKTEKNVVWKKLSSRKLWVALGAFITTMGVTWGFDNITTEQLAGTCVAISSLLTYIGAEGFADGRSPTNKTDDIYLTYEEETHDK